jgi:hypothetical protein
MSTIETGIDKILCADCSTQIAEFDIENALKHATLSFHVDFSGGWSNDGIITLNEKAQAVITFIADSNKLYVHP